MSRPTPEQVEKITAMLEASGQHVMSKGHYVNLRLKIERMTGQLLHCEAEAVSMRQWAENCLQGERQARNRLEQVVMAAASLGVSIQDINAALAAADQDED